MRDLVPYTLIIKDRSIIVNKPYYMTLPQFKRTCIIRYGVVSQFRKVNNV